jgi:hypothetical protein
LVAAREPDDLVATFARAVLAQGEAIRSGDHRLGNRHAKAYTAAADALIAAGDASIDSFCSLLEHPSDQVRTMAAAFLLSRRTKLALATLEPIARGKGLAALGAQNTLERYRRGDLEIR